MIKPLYYYYYYIMEVNSITYKLFLLNEFNILQGFGSEFDRLIKTILATVRHVNEFDYFGLQSLRKKTTIK